MTYLAFFDDNPKRSTAQKVAEAMMAFKALFGYFPRTLLVSETDAAQPWGQVAPGIEVVVSALVRKDMLGLVV